MIFSRIISYRKGMNTYNQQKNIASMIEIRGEEITGFVERKNICAVVNAASPELMGSSSPSVDKAIHDAIDKKIKNGSTFKQKIMEELDENQNLPQNIVRCKRGKTVVTSGYGFCDYVIHVVGTEYDGKHEIFLNGKYTKFGVSSSCIGKLENCYFEIINSIRKHPDITSVAIPVISSGNYGFPFKLAARIAIASLGNALVEWRNEDPELFDKALLKKIYICVYNPRVQGNTEVKEVEKIWNRYRKIFAANQKAVYQNSLVAHVRYLSEILKYDNLRGYFAIAKMFRLILLLIRTFFLPIVMLKDLIGKNNWRTRRTVVEITAFCKLFLPIFIVNIILGTKLQTDSCATQILIVIIIYMMMDTITYLLTLIVLADIQRPSANIIRSLLFLFVNYMEVNLDIALLYYMFNPNLSKFMEAIQFGILPETVSISQTYSPLLYLNYGVKFFFMTLAFGYFSNHLRQRKFSS